MPSEINQTEESRLSFYSHSPKNAFKYFYYSIFFFFFNVKNLLSKQKRVWCMAEGRGGGAEGKSTRIESIPCGGIKKFVQPSGKWLTNLKQIANILRSAAKTITTITQLQVCKENTLTIYVCVCACASERFQGNLEYFNNFDSDVQ